MQNYFPLVTEANHRHAEHERRVNVVASDLLAADPNASGWQSVRQMLAQVQAVTLAWLPMLAALSARLSLGADRAGTRT